MAPPGQMTGQMFSPRTGVPPGQHILRSPVYNRPQFIPSPVMSAPSPSDNYSNIQTPEDNTRPNCFIESDNMVSPSDPSQYGQKIPGGPMTPIDTSDMGNTTRGPSASPQGQETRQHLRDLLQRQQVKKLEQDQMSPTMEPPQQNAPRMWSQGMSISLAFPASVIIYEGVCMCI